MYQQFATSSQNATNDSFERPPILIIEDDKDTLDLMCAFLSRKYECDDAYDGEQALTKMMANNYSVILSDLMMPNVDGYGVVGNAALFAPTTPVIVVSGLSDLQAAVKAMKMGAFDYIVKPFNLDQIETSLRRALIHHQVSQTEYINEQLLTTYAAYLEQENDKLTKELNKALLELELDHCSTVRALAHALESRNFEMRGHSDRVVAYSLKLGDALGLDEAELKELEVGALLHDIGKIGVRDRVLLKPEALSCEEWVEMKKHPLVGAKIIEDIPALHGVRLVILQHHERWNGSGYPSGLQGEQINLNARIFAVADAFDAITSDRPYDSPRSYEEASAELAGGSGKQFDPKVVEAFFNIPRDAWALPTGKAFSYARR